MGDKKDTKAAGSIDKQRPFLGLRAYEEKNKAQFGGRDQEIVELFGLVENNLLTIVFGKSGIGKTSLIKAGLIPELRQNFYFPIYVRIDYSSSRSPLDQVRNIVYEEMRAKDSGIPEIGNSTLWEYFHNVDLLDDLVVPVLILDQFEELFTLGEGKPEVTDFLVQLADLSENRIPLKVQGEYQRWRKTVPTHYAEQPYRVILSLREDYLANLEELKKYIPSIMMSRFRVVQMTIAQALDAAVKPGKGLIDETVALEIIRKLPGISQDNFEVSDIEVVTTSKLRVEPFLLSLICDRLNEKRIEKGLETITVDLVSQFNVSHVIRSFYEESIAAFGDEVERAIENQLLTEGGFRKLQALEGFQQKHNISDVVIDCLVDARILRKEIRDGVDYVELIHDVLAPIIKKKRDYRKRQEREAKRQAAIIRAKRRQRRRLVRITSVIALAMCLILTLISVLAYKSRRDRIMVLERIEKMGLARNLIFNSKIVGSFEGDAEKSALLARLGYLVFEENKDKMAGENMYDKDFYNAMYKALKLQNFLFFVEKFDVGVRSIVHVDSEELLVGLDDGSLLSINGATGETVKLHAFDNGVIASMDYYLTNEGKGLLAIAGTFDSIFIYDVQALNMQRAIAIPQQEQTQKLVTFDHQGNLILRQFPFVFQWDSSFEKYKIDSLENHSISSMKFDYETESLIVGNTRGEIFMISQSDTVKSGVHLAHTSVVTDIDISTDGKRMATGSMDQTVVVWNRNTWDFLPLGPEALNGSHGFVNCVSFGPNNEFVYAGYDDGTILKWPVSLGFIEDLICGEITRNLSETEWESYTQGIIQNEKSKYTCEKVSTVGHVME